MKFKTRRRLFIVALIAIVSPLPVLLKAMVVLPAIQLLLIDSDEWRAENG
ncbi:hypothetical protein LQF61_04170 [Tetragenococcus koreensis]|nr:hypothetical protein [Tetragenococcus koreensis]MCF1614114.1 hypothetical protein [Tetragenococcus koreensis]MCF1619277.1 hypothetical protein [Tetragenococcus koreensis]MCF1623892.1 hypothetical protein [Tetragenococcus koreensis]MCF1656759.1 hypothetical protein [Tetragenococcus koreensis]